MLKLISLLVTITTYNPCPEQGWSDGTITADGSKIENPNCGWVAISHDLFDKGFRYGDKISIDGKTYVIKDKMNKRYKNCIDIMQSKDRKNYKKKSVINFYIDVQEYEKRTGTKRDWYSEQRAYYTKPTTGFDGVFNKPKVSDGYGFVNRGSIAWRANK